MPNVDKVLEAEESIQTIASELKRMKSAADLMDAAQKKVDAVISSSSEIIEKTGIFVKEGSKIVAQIGEYNIQEDMGKLTQSTQKIEENVQETKKTITENTTQITNDISDLSEKFESKTDIVLEKVESKLEVINIYTKKINRTLILLFSINIVLAIILLLKVFEII